MVKITGFVQRNPHDGSLASERTEAYLGYDDKNLYAIFICFDRQPHKIRARLSRREDARAFRRRMTDNEFLTKVEE